MLVNGRERFSDCEEYDIIWLYEFKESHPFSLAAILSCSMHSFMKTFAMMDSVSVVCRKFWSVYFKVPWLLKSLYVPACILQRHNLKPFQLKTFLLSNESRMFLGLPWSDYREDVSKLRNVSKILISIKKLKVCRGMISRFVELI